MVWWDLGGGDLSEGGYGKGWAGEGGDPYGFRDGGGRAESMEPGNTHWALMEWALESAEGTSLEHAAKRIRLDRRAAKMLTSIKYIELQHYGRTSARWCINNSQFPSRGCCSAALIPRQLCFLGTQFSGFT